MYVPNTPKIDEPQSKELADALAENARLRKELELAKIRDENRRMQEEINRLNWPNKIPYTDPYNPNIVYCTLEA